MIERNFRMSIYLASANHLMRLRHHTLMISCLLIAGIGLIGGEARLIHAADSELDDQYIEVINSFLQSRQKLKTGIVRYHGQYRFHRTMDISGLYIFDFPAGLLRIDASLQTTELDGTPVQNAVQGFQFAIQEKKTLLKYRDEPTPRTVIDLPMELPVYFSKFDLRVMGANDLGWNQRPLKDLALSFDAQRQDVAEVTREDNRVRVTWVARVKNEAVTRRMIWFRVDHDYCPEKIEVSLRKRASGAFVADTDRVEWDEPSQSQRLEVIEFRGQWVPSKLAIVNGQTRRDLEFSWKSLNEPLDADAFELDFDPK